MGGSDSGKGRVATVLAVGGLCVSLIGNYLQYQKNKTDAENAQQQIAIAQQQAKTAQEELELKRTQFDAGQIREDKRAQNCDQLLAERDDALLAVHKYDNAITKHQLNLHIEKQQLAMAQTDGSDFRIAQHRSLAEMEENFIKSLTESRNEASARVQDIEQNCK